MKGRGSGIEDFWDIFNHTHTSREHGPTGGCQRLPILGAVATGKEGVSSPVERGIWRIPLVVINFVGVCGEKRRLSALNLANTLHSLACVL